jgi:predicted nucleic acid-binding protein
VTPWAIADTGALVAVLDRAERHHAWAVDQLRRLQPPLLVCEPVLTEAMFLLARLPAAQDALLGLIEGGVARPAFHVEDHVGVLRSLCRKYRDLPMSLADACVVRMSELFDQHQVFTLDSDFVVYRKHGNKPIDLIVPG